MATLTWNVMLKQIKFIFIWLLTGLISYILWKDRNTLLLKPHAAIQNETYALPDRRWFHRLQFCSHDQI